MLLALLTAVAGLVSVAAPAHAASDVTFLSKFGSRGTAPGQFRTPWDVATGPNGDVFVADTSNGRVQQFTADGAHVRSIGTGLISNVFGVDVDADGNVYATSNSPASVVKFRADGTHLATFSGEGISSPQDVAVGPDGSIYVSNHSHVSKLTASGGFVSRLGTPDTGNGQFASVYGLAVGSDGTVYVPDFSNNRVLRFTAAGVYVSSLTHDGDRGLQNPIKVDTNALGQVAVSEYSRPGVTVFSAEGGVDASWGARGTESGQFLYPSGVALDDDGHVFVADMNGDNVQSFGLAPVFSGFTPTISGSGRAGDELSVAASTTPEPASWSYAWTVSGDDEVRSTGTTFTPGLADVGETVTVSVTAHGTDGEPRDRSATATKVVAPALMDATATIVDSTPETAPTTGDVLSVEVDESGLPEGATGSAMWGRVVDEDCVVLQRRAAPAGGEYTVVDGDAGATICAEVTYVAAGHETLRKTAVASDTAVGTFTVAQPSVDVQVPIVGETVTATVDLEDAPEGAEVAAWSWGVVDAQECVAIDGTDSRTFTPAVDDFDRRLCVSVTVRAPHHVDATSTTILDAVEAGAFAESPSVTIDGWPQVGVESSISVTGGDPSDAERQYQWNLDGEPIEGATDATYTPNASDEGQGLSVTVTSSARGYVDDVTTSVAVVVATGDLNVPPPAFSTDRPAVGVPVSLPVDLTDAPSGAEAHWRWGVVADEDCRPIDGATSDTFTPSADQVGQVLCVVAGVRAPGYGQVGGTVVLENAVVRGTLPAIRSVLSTTSPKVGAKLTASLFATALPEGATTTVSWGYSQANTACRPSAAAASFTTTSAMVGRKVCALVTVSAPGYVEWSTVLRTGLVTETGMMTVTPRTIKGTAKFTVRAQGLKPGQRFQIVTAGKDVRGKADSYGRVVRTIKYAKGLKSKTRVVGIRGYNAQGKTTFAKKVKVTYRAR